MNFIPLFLVITGFNDNDNMMLVVKLVVVFVVNFTMNKMRFRVDYTRTSGLSVGPFVALFHFHFKSTGCSAWGKVENVDERSCG